MSETKSEKALQVEIDRLRHENEKLWSAIVIPSECESGFTVAGSVSGTFRMGPLFGMATYKCKTKKQFVAEVRRVLDLPQEPETIRFMPEQIAYLKKLFFDAIEAATGTPA